MAHIWFTRKNHTSLALASLENQSQCSHKSCHSGHLSFSGFPRNTFCFPFLCGGQATSNQSFVTISKSSAENLEVHSFQTWDWKVSSLLRHPSKEDETANRTTDLAKEIPLQILFIKSFLETMILLYIL